SGRPCLSPTRALLDTERKASSMTAEPEPTRPLTPYERFVEATKRVLSVSKTSAPYRGFGTRSTIVGVPPSAGPNFAKSLIVVPRWTPENRPVVDGAKPASEVAPSQARVFYRVRS